MFVDSNIRFPAGAAIPRSAAPVTAQVVVAANSTVTISHNDGQIVLSGAPAGAIEDAGTSEFTIRNSTGSQQTIDYFYW